MHAQYEHSPPTSSASTTAIDAPQSWQRPAMFSPAEPPPITITSKCSITVIYPRWRGPYQVSDENDAMTTVLGIDIGGTGIKGAPVDTRSGQLLADRHRILTPHPATPDAVTEVVARAGEVLRLDRTHRCHVPRGGEGRRRPHRGQRRPGVDRHRRRRQVLEGDRRRGHGRERRRRRGRGGDDVRRGQGSPRARDHDHARYRDRQRAVHGRRARAQHRARSPQDGQARRRAPRGRQRARGRTTCRGRTGRSASTSTS